MLKISNSRRRFMASPPRARASSRRCGSRAANKPAPPAGRLPSRTGCVLTGTPTGSCRMARLKWSSRSFALTPGRVGRISPIVGSPSVEQVDVVGLRLEHLDRVERRVQARRALRVARAQRFDGRIELGAVVDRDPLALPCPGSATSALSLKPMTWTFVPAAICVVSQSTVLTTCCHFGARRCCSGDMLRRRRMLTIVRSSMLVDVSTRITTCLPPMRRPVRYWRLPSPSNARKRPSRPRLRLAGVGSSSRDCLLQLGELARAAARSRLAARSESSRQRRELASASLGSRSRAPRAPRAARSTRGSGSRARSLERHEVALARQHPELPAARFGLAVLDDRALLRARHSR